MSVEDVPISVDLEGTSYAGTYQVSGGNVVVTFGKLRKSTPLKGMSEAILARQLLRELVREQSKAAG
jgi:hypothetical protein